MITESLKQEADYNYRYIWLLLIAVTSWGVVPGFAKLGNLGGDITTFYVNWVAVFAVAAIITITGQWQKIRNYTSKQYLIMVALGIAWPLVYSVAYFESVNVGGPALATILNYSWPLFALFFAHLISRKKAGKFSVIAVVLASVAVAVTCYFKQNGEVGLSLIALCLGITAAITQGFYSSATDRWSYDPWIMTLIVELVTALGVSIIILVRGSFVWPSLTTLGYLSFIGAISNGVGFWAFLAGSQVSSGNPNSRATWLIGMCLVPFAQIALAALLGVATVSIGEWCGVIIIVVSLLINRFGPLVTNKNN